MRKYVGFFDSNTDEESDRLYQFFLIEPDYGYLYQTFRFSYEINDFLNKEEFEFTGVNKDVSDEAILLNLNTEVFFRKLTTRGFICDSEITYGTFQDFLDEFEKLHKRDYSTQLVPHQYVYATITVTEEELVFGFEPSFRTPATIDASLFELWSRCNDSSKTPNYQVLDILDEDSGSWEHNRFLTDFDKLKFGHLWDGDIIASNATIGDDGLIEEFDDFYAFPTYERQSYGEVLIKELNIVFINSTRI
jgi:hypothetical protein